MEVVENVGDFEVPTTQAEEELYPKLTTPEYEERNHDIKKSEEGNVETNEEEKEGEKKINEERRGEHESEDQGEDSKTLSHPELKLFFQEALSRLIQSDPMLADLHPQVTPEEVRTYTFVELLYCFATPNIFIINFLYI